MKFAEKTTSEFSIPLVGSYVGGIEEAYLSDALMNSRNLSHGPHLEKLRMVLRESTGAHVSLVSSGTAGIHLALLALNIGPGDQVAVATQSFIASSGPVIYVGAEPVFIDSDPNTWTLDPELLGNWLEAQESARQLPRALIVVDLFGNCPDFGRIRELCSDYRIPIIEDAAHAMGGYYRESPAGTLGDLGVFSLNGNKIITGATGGVVVAREKKWIDRIDFLANQCKINSDNTLGEYLHSEVGFNYRFNNLSAALSLAQITEMTERIEKKRVIAERYRAELGALPGVETMPVTPGAKHTFWLNCIKIDPSKFGVDASTVVRNLRASGIEATMVWKPLHEQPAFQSFRRIGGSVSESLNRNAICLPSSIGLTGSEQETVINCIRNLQTA